MPLDRVKSSAVRLLAALSLAALLAPAAAHAEFGTTNFQLLQGYNFYKDVNGTTDGLLTTLTINHYSTWGYGDNFFFADLTRGRFGAKGTSGVETGSAVYTEWHPRLFLNKLGLPGGSFIKNWGLAGEVNAGGNFYAYLAGATVDLAIPGFQVAGLSVFYRYDQYALHTWQVSPWWDVPFKTGPIGWDFSGFVDVTTNRDGKIDVMAQPELLIDVGNFFGNPGKFHAGTELYIHSFTDFGGKSQTVFAPQVMVQWTPFTQFVP
jgi:nucleoside-specific outer membrane channel protein Tsx